MIQKRTVATALATAALTACANPAATQQAAASALETPAGTFDRVVARVYGTTEQRLATEEARWRKAEITVRDCMAKRGQAYTPVPFDPMPVPLISPGDLLAFAPVRTDFGVGESIKVRAAAGEASQPNAKDEGFSAALSACTASNAQPPTGGVPPQEVLDGQLVNALSAVEKATLPLLGDTYKTCLTSKGTPADNLSDLYRTVLSTYPAPSYEQPSDPTKFDNWAAAVAFEKKAAAADAACRAGVTDTALIAAQPVLIRFEQEHATELAAVSADWAKAVTDLPALRAKLK